MLVDASNSKSDLSSSVEVIAKPRARTFNSDYKIKVVREITACKTKAEIGAFLRREGLYSSLVSKWCRSFAQGGAQSLRTAKRGAKIKQTTDQIELERLRRENTRLKKNLADAELIIDTQKKLSQLLNFNRDPDEIS